MLIEYIEQAHGATGALDVTTGAFVPYIRGANIGKAVSRIFTPPGTGGQQAAAQAAVQAPTPPPLQGATGVPSPESLWGYNSVGVGETQFPGYEPAFTANVLDLEQPGEFGNAVAQQYQEAQNLAQSGPGYLSSVLQAAGFEPGTTELSPEAQAYYAEPRALASAAENQVQEALTQPDLNFGIDPWTEYQIQQSNMAFNNTEAAQLGPGWQTSTAGSQALAQQQLANEEARYTARQTALTTYANLAENYRSINDSGLANLNQLSQTNPYLASAQMQTNAANLDLAHTQLLAQQEQFNAQSLNQGSQSANAVYGTKFQAGTNQSMNQYGTTAQSIGQGASGVGGLLGLGIGALSLLSDARMKYDITPLFQRKGVWFYTYRRKDDDPHVVHVGPIAQEVAQKDPSAVHQDPDTGQLKIGANALRKMLA